MPAEKSRYSNRSLEGSSSDERVQSDKPSAGGSYLAVMMDLYSRRVVGLAVSSTADAALVCHYFSI
nr:hypothetical protein [Photorhabdus australis]